MSTVDPVAARAHRVRRPPGPAVVGGLLALLLIGGFGLGYGWSSLLSIGPNGDALFEPSTTGAIAAVLGLPLSIVSFVAWIWTATRRPGLGAFLGVTAFWAGGAVGALCAELELDEPAPKAIGATSVAMAAAFTAAGLRAARRRRAGRLREAEVMRTGTRTTATVSDKGYVLFLHSARILTTVTFTFVDAGGVRRWVQRRMVIRAEDPVVDGQTTDLWYDPADPGDDDKIVVKLAIDSRPELAL